MIKVDCNLILMLLECLDLQVYCLWLYYNIKQEVIKQYNNPKNGKIVNIKSFPQYFLTQNQIVLSNHYNNQYFYGNIYGNYYFFPNQIWNQSYSINHNAQKSPEKMNKSLKQGQNEIIVPKNQKQISKTEQNNQNQEREEVIYLQNRNVLPNCVSFIVSHIRRINKSGKLVKKIINKLSSGKEGYQAKQYFAYQAYLKQNCTDYVNNDAINILADYLDKKSLVYTVDEQIFYNKVTRTLISTYLKENSILQVLGSGKIKKSSIPDHLKVHRYLQEVLKAPQKCKFIIKYH